MQECEAVRRKFVQINAGTDLLIYYLGTSCHELGRGADQLFFLRTYLAVLYCFCLLNK